MGEAMIYGGEPTQAIEKIKGAISRNPETPYWYWWNLGRAYYMAKQYKNAVDAIAKISDPPLDVLLITAASKAQLGNLEAAKSDMAHSPSTIPNGLSPSQPNISTARTVTASTGLRACVKRD